MRRMSVLNMSNILESRYLISVIVRRVCDVGRPHLERSPFTNAMIRLLEEKEEVIQNMAKESFLIAKNKFEINKVNDSLFNIMGL